jgi:hypothetical protein
VTTPNPRDADPLKPPPKRGGLFSRWFDEHSDGSFVKTLLIVMLMIATAVQPLSLIYTAYGTHLPTNWWEWTPALAVLLFLALDWTILPLAYFFATTAKPALKLMLGVMLAVVAVGAFDGYFTATERFISMRLEEITKHGLAVESAEEAFMASKGAQQEMITQQATDRAHLDGQRKELSEKIARLDAQTATAQKTLDDAQGTHLKLMTEIKDGCLKVAYVCLGPQQEKERARYEGQKKDLQAQIAGWQADKTPLNAELKALGANDGLKVDAANGNVEKASTELKTKKAGFEAAVLNNQVYRWAGTVFGKSPRNVSPEEANKVLFIFAGAVAASYVVAQVMLSIAFYGRHRKGVVESTKVSWGQMTRSLRGYWLRKRRGVYRDRTKEVFVPTSERTRVVYVPVNPGGPVPPAEEFVSKPGSKVSHG